MMKKQLCIFLVSLFILGQGCSQRVNENSFFNYRVENTNSDYPILSLTPSQKSVHKSITSDCLIRDSLIISLGRGEHLFSISPISNEDSVLLFCRRGRTYNEPISSLPLSDLYDDVTGNRCADVFSYNDGKLLVWNVTESIKRESDVFEKISYLNNGLPLPVLSTQRLNEKLICVYDSGQDPDNPNLLYPPCYKIIDTDSGKVINQFSPFRILRVKTDNLVFSMKTFLSTVDCLSPDKTKLIYAMSYLPVINILDLKTGETKGYRIRGAEKFSPSFHRWFFADVQADDKFIYALYSGKVFDGRGSEIPNNLFIFDWSGKIFAEYKLERGYTNLNIDNGYLYLSCTDGALASIECTAFVSPHCTGTHTLFE